MHVHALVLAVHCALVAAVPAQATNHRDVIVYTRAELERAGYVRLADFLQRLPPASVEQNALYNNGGDGRELADLRQLGARYAQVRVDGRRWPAGSDGTVDLSGIAWVDIERIELDLAPDVVRAGSGAIAGVVNVVTRRNFRGAEASVRRGAYDEADGQASYVDFALGAGDERTGVAMGISHDESEPVAARDRAISAVPLFGFPANDVRAGASSTTPFGRFGRTLGGPTVTLLPGRAGTSPADFRPFDPATDGYNFAAETYLQSPSERTALFAHAMHALGDATHARVDVAWNERRSQQRLAPFPIAVDGYGSDPRIAATNLYNPFGFDVERYQYRNTILPRTFDRDVDTLRATAALDGALDVGGRALAWDVAWTHGEVESHAVVRGRLDLARLARGLGPSFRAADGTPTCGTPAAPIAGCVPIDLFSGPDAFTPAMAAYAGLVQQDAARDVLDEATATLAGELARLPAGPLRFESGATWRRESTRFDPDAVAVLGGTTGTRPPSGPAEAPLRGTRSARELHFSLDVPLLADALLAESLSLAIGARSSRLQRDGEPARAPYDTAPVIPRREPDASRPSLDGRFVWQPFAEWRVDGGWSRGFVEPAFEQLFGAQGNNFPVLFDPCVDSLDPTGIVRERCEQGIGGIAPVRPGSDFAYDNPAWTGGGNPRLDPETTTQRQLTVAWQPVGVPGLAIGIGWHRIVVTDQPVFRTAQFIVDRCYVRGDLDACSYFTRYPQGGAVATLLTGWINDGSTESESWDLSLRQRWASSPGTFDLRWETSYLAYYGEAGQAPRGACIGEIVENRGEMYCDEIAFGNQVGNYFDRGRALNRIRSRLALDWQRADWGATATVRWLSGLDESCYAVDALAGTSACDRANDPTWNGPSHHIPDTAWLDLEARWDTPWQARLRLGVHNATDRDPPVSYSIIDGNFDPDYEVPGRFWYAGYVQRF